jgi:hypothetical protein
LFAVAITVVARAYSDNPNSSDQSDLADLQTVSNDKHQIQSINRGVAATPSGAALRARNRTALPASTPCPTCERASWRWTLHGHQNVRTSALTIRNAAVVTPPHTCGLTAPGLCVSWRWRWL